MKSMWIIAAAAAGYLAVPFAQAACIYPRAPEHLPDGKTASYEEMIQAKQDVEKFNEDINSYNACLDMAMKALDESGLYEPARLEELRLMQAKKNNAAVDEVQSVADQFNEQLRAFKARDKKDD